MQFIMSISEPSLKSLMTLFNFYDMEVFDVRRADRYGGNIRAYVANNRPEQFQKCIRPCRLGKKIRSWR